MGENLEAAVRAIVFFNSSWAALLASKWDYWKHKPVSDDRVTERKKINFSDVWGVWYVICIWIFIPPVIKTVIKADTLPHKSTQEMIFFFFVISIR